MKYKHSALIIVAAIMLAGCTDDNKTTTGTTKPNSGSNLQDLAKVLGEGTESQLNLTESRLLADGVIYARYTPRKFTKDVYCLTIDMDNPNVELEGCWSDDICPNPYFESTNNGKKLREVLSSSCLRRRKAGHNVVAGVNGDYYETMPGTMLSCHIQEGETVYIPNPRNLMVHVTFTNGFTVFKDRTLSTEAREISCSFSWNGVTKPFYSVNDTIVRLSPKSAATAYQGANLYNSRFKEIPFASQPSLTNPISPKAMFVVMKGMKPLEVNTGDIPAKVLSVTDGRDGSLAKAPYVSDEDQWVLQLTGATADAVKGIKAGDDISIRVDMKIGGEIKPIKTHIGGIFRFIHEGEYVPVPPSRTNETKRATVAGIDKTGRKAIIVCLNTTSLLYPQVCEVCKLLGVHEGIRFDGGGSTEMWIWDGRMGEIACPSSDSRGTERSNMNYLHICTGGN